MPGSTVATPVSTNGTALLSMESSSLLGPLRGDSAFRAVFGNWTLSPRIEIASGRPYNLLTGNDRTLINSGETARPNVVPLETFGSYPSPDGEVGLALPPVGSIGNLGRNVYRTDTFSSVDFRLTRKIPVKNGVVLNISTDVFNLFNRVNVQEGGYGIYPVRESSECFQSPTDPVWLETHVLIGGLVRGLQKLCIEALRRLRTVPCMALFCQGDILAQNSSHLLARADQLAWRGNWVKAGLLYEQAERELERSEIRKAPAEPGLAGYGRRCRVAHAPPSRSDQSRANETPSLRQSLN